VRRIKLVLSVTLLAGAVAALATQSVAYPPFLAQAKKFGAKDCRFCHVNAEGGTPFNDRGKWLVAEKDRRHADAVDPAWLAGYKKSAKKKK
jgi:cytochrome c5